MNQITNMKKFIITTTINEEIEAENEDEAREKFFESVEGEPQQTLATYFSDNLKIEEESEIFDPKGRIENEVGITKEMQNAGGNWTPDYKEGFIDGLKRSLELFNPKN